MNTEMEHRARAVHRSGSPRSRPRPHLTVADVMSTTLVTVTPETGFKRMASLMRSHKISGLPVVDGQDRPLGVVSETDLLAKQRRQAAPMISWLHPGRTLDNVRGRGTTADEVMTTPAQTITPHASLVVAARRLHDGGVRRLLVVDENGRLAGVLTRNDLLRVFLRRDDDIEADVEGILRRWEPALDEHARASVRDGVVTLRGEAGSQDDVDALVTLIEVLDGVVEVVAEELTASDLDLGL